MSASQAELLLEAQLSQAGIPFVREFRFAEPRRWRADFALWQFWGSPDWQDIEPDFLIEVDGGSWLPKGRHTTGSGFAADCEKLNAAAELGYRTLRYTPAMIDDGTAIAQIRRILSKKEESNAAA